MSYLYGMGYGTCINFVGEKKIQVNKFFNLGGFISFVS